MGFNSAFKGLKCTAVFYNISSNQTLLTVPSLFCM